MILFRCAFETEGNDRPLESSIEFAQVDSSCPWSIYVPDGPQTRLAWARGGGKDIRLEVGFIICSLR